MKPGCTELTRMRSPANWTAAVFVMMRMAAAGDDLVGDLLAFSLEDVGDDHLGAFPGEDRGLALPHATRSARDERDFSGESHRVLSFLAPGGVLSGSCERPAEVPPLTDNTSPVT